MNRFLLASVLLFCSSWLKGQDIVITLEDTVFVSANVTTYILFPAKITTMDVGNKKVFQRISPEAPATALLKVTDLSVEPTSMFVQCEGGWVFNGVIAVKPKLSKTLYNFKVYEGRARDPKGQISSPGPSPVSSSSTVNNTSGNNVNGTGQAPPAVLSDEVEVAGDKYSLKKIKEDLAKTLEQKPYYKSYGVIAHGLTFQLANIYIHKRLGYVTLRLTNNSSIVYVIENVEFKNSSGRKVGINTSSSQSFVEPITDVSPKEVTPKSVGVIAVAIPVQMVNGTSKLEITIRERDGIRTLTMLVEGSTFLTAQPF